MNLAAPYSKVNQGNYYRPRRGNPQGTVLARPVRMKAAKPCKTAGMSRHRLRMREGGCLASDLNRGLFPSCLSIAVERNVTAFTIENDTVA